VTLVGGWLAFPPWQGGRELLTLVLHDSEVGTVYGD